MSATYTWILSAWNGLVNNTRGIFIQKRAKIHKIQKPRDSKLWFGFSTLKFGGNQLLTGMHYIIKLLNLGYFFSLPPVKNLTTKNKNVFLPLQNTRKTNIEKKISQAKNCQKLRWVVNWRSTESWFSTFTYTKLLHIRWTLNSFCRTNCLCSSKGAQTKFMDFNDLAEEDHYVQVN
jgi:hypothetical protein